MTELVTLETQLMAEVAAATDEQSIEAVRVAALGKKGSVSELLKTLGSMSPEERQTRGAAINALKNSVTDAINARKGALKDAAIDAKLKAETVTKLAKNPAAYPFVLATSSEKNEGIDEMRAAIIDVLKI